MNFLETEAQRFGINRDCLAYKYLQRKTKAADRGSKARRSLGNLYALKVLSEDFINQAQGSSFTTLMSRMKSLPFGSKLQNHPLDNRLNDEVKRTYNVRDDTLLPVQGNSVNGQKIRFISQAFLADHGNNPINTAKFIVSTIDEYISIISTNQETYLEEIESAEDPAVFVEILNLALASNSDARLFEIVSYAILRAFFNNQMVTIIQNEVSTDINLSLYRTGRTNANDGGIDFVLQPLGKFFQVTETLDFRKYFLDFDKTNRFPLNFVVKTELTSQQVLAQIRTQAASAMSADTLEKYITLFENIYTNVDLRIILDNIIGDAVLLEETRQVILEQFKLEYGLLDN